MAIHTRYPSFFILFLLLPLFVGLARGGIVPVSTVAQFESALTNVQAGDIITLAPGTYTMTRRKFTLSGKNGAAGNRIAVRAATWRTVTIRWVTDGSTYIEGFLLENSAYWTLENLIMEADCSSDASDDLCEHLIHITGSSDFFELRTSILRNANAQIKLNSFRGTIPITQPAIFPNNGVVEWCEFFDAAPRRTSNPVTKLNIDGTRPAPNRKIPGHILPFLGGRNWMIRGNYIHDFQKGQGDFISFAAFYKAGTTSSIFERNVVQCESLHSGGTRIGLTLGQPTSPDTACENNVCIPFSVSCWSRNNVQFGCPATPCTFVQRSPGARVAHEASCEIQFRFLETNNAQAQNNIVAGPIRLRDGAVMAISTPNLVSLGATFGGKFRDPANGDFRLAVGNENDAQIIGKGATLSWVTDDFCGNPRTAPYDLGPLQYSLYRTQASCLTSRPNHPFFGQAGACHVTVSDPHLSHHSLRRNTTSHALTLAIHHTH